MKALHRNNWWFRRKRSLFFFLTFPEFFFNGFMWGCVVEDYWFLLYFAYELKICLNCFPWSIFSKLKDDFIFCDQKSSKRKLCCSIRFFPYVHSVENERQNKITGNPQWRKNHFWSEEPGHWFAISPDDNWLSCSSVDRPKLYESHVERPTFFAFIFINVWDFVNVLRLYAFDSKFCVFT